MSWRDLIVTSAPSAHPQKGNIEDLRNSDPQETCQTATSLHEEQEHIEAETPVKRPCSPDGHSNDSDGCNSEDFEDFEPRYKNKSSFFIEDSSPESLQILKPQEVSSISSKPIPSTSGPESPLKPGWLVVYRNTHGRLSGGPDDRINGTVEACTWDGAAWTVLLTSGDRIQLGRVLAVSKTDAAGRVLTAWTVRAHGYRGDR